MKSKKLTRIASLLLSVFVAFGMLAAFTVKPEAGSGSYYDIFTKKPLYVGEKGYVGAYYGETYLQIVSVKSSNPSVVKVKYNGYGEYYYTVGKKIGKAKVTISYRDLNGNIQTANRLVRVKKYPYEIKSLSVGGKKVNTNKKKFSYETRYKKTTVPVNMKLKKGWEISYINAGVNLKNGKWKDVKVTKKMLTGGKTIKFPKKYNSLSIFVTMNKGNEYIDYEIYLYR